MKGRVKNIIIASFFATMLVFITGGGALAEYHHVDGCTVCHDMYGGGDCGDYTNLRLIYCDLSTPNSGIKTVKFTCNFSQESPCDPEGTNSYADGDAIYDGVCEVCHTNTRHHRNDGNNPDPDPHYAGEDCITCHSHSDEFSHGGGAGTGCESCHGHDAGYEYEPGELSEGAGTFKSHSTHTENDADDLKGPNIACGACHDTANYPYFKSGTDGDGNGVFDLSETDVCDNCHSPGGAFDGVDDPASGAKTNWADGIYNANGITLKSGKEKWCAGCHDDAPAYSQFDEIVIDNMDPNYVSYLGTWGTSTYAPGYYGANYHYHTAASGTDTFTWTITITTPGTYEVFARWTEHSNRAPDATYTIYHDSGSTDVVKDQRSNGGTWVSLGIYSFNGVDDYVELIQSSSGIVIADAITWVPPGTPIPDIGIYAPSVIGDDFTYGFYATGHGAHGWVECLSCHNARIKHIDHKHRTYASTSNNYQAGYRLAKPMVVPRPNHGSPSNPHDHPEDFALCGDCHNLYEVLGENEKDVSHTNLWKDDGSPRNSHYYHLKATFDSDWDGVVDSKDTCITCHNVHGSPSVGPMLRHGELISTYGTTDKVPALNFSYLPSGAELWNSTAGRIAMVGPHVDQNGVCNACHSSYTLNRTPYLGPKVLTTKADPDPAPRDGETDVVLTAVILDHNDNVFSVTIDLTDIGGGSTNMYDDGDTENHGDEVSGDGTYSCKTTIPGSVDDGVKTLLVEADDPDGPTGTNYLVMTVKDPAVVDNLEGTFTGTWGTSTYAPGYYGANYHYHTAASGTDTFTWTITITTPGTYEVFARWTQNPSRAPDATYTIYHDSGSIDVVVDQRSNGGTWVSLGTYDFDGTGVEKVELVQSASGIVIADAILFEPVP
jgi:hypothetical protein